MTNRKLMKTGVLTNSALSLIVFVTTAGTLLPTADTQKPLNDSIQWVKFNPELLELSGLPESEAANAPVITLNKQASLFVNAYVRQNNDVLEDIKERSPRFFSIMDSVFSRYHLPRELKYLAVVESELNTKAVSKVGAVGTWQLMPQTARLLSLKVNAHNDERKLLYKSTVAAAKYLNDLHDLFDDWLLTIAAYNAGPAPVYKAIKRSGSRNFWKLQNFLPAETRGHVKRFIATHCYFQEENSLTMLTKAETKAYLKEVSEFKVRQNLELDENTIIAVR